MNHSDSAGYDGPLLPVAEIVPHAPPMLAVEELLEWSPGKARARMTVRAGLFDHDGRVESVMTLEYMAQTVAACLGHEAVQDGHSVRVGMVIACRTMSIHRPRLRLGEKLEIRVEQARGTDSLSHYDTWTHDEAGRLVASAQLTLIHGEKPPEDARGGTLQGPRP